MSVTAAGAFADTVVTKCVSCENDEHALEWLKYSYIWSHEHHGISNLWQLDILFVQANNTETIVVSQNKESNSA